MSDENQNQVDRPDGLSRDGKVIEAMLESVQLPASNVNRDVLMYEAGWNAAKAELGLVVEPAVTTRLQSRTIWPALTAAFAAAAAILLVMVVQKRPAVEPELSSGDVVVEEVVELASDEMAAAEEPLEPMKLRDVPSPAKAIAFFDFRPQATYRQRIEKFLRDSHNHVTPVVFDGDFDDRKTKRLKTGSFLNAEELVDDLL